MFTNPEFGRVIKWRYLDSLDSTRYSNTFLVDEEVDKPKCVEQASIEVSATFLMGSGITVPANQLIDSFGFLRIASEIIKAATMYKNKGKNIFFPIKYAFFDYGHEKNLGGGPHLIDPFLLAAYLFDKDGDEGRKYFLLSAWPKLGKRRRKWAEALRKRPMAIPTELIKDDDVYEPQLSEDLIRVLSFFDINRDFIIDAAKTTDIREEMVRYISNLTLEEIKSDEYFMDILDVEGSSVYEKRLTKVLEIVNVFNKLEKKEINGIKIIDNRSDIKDELVNSEGEYFEGDASTINESRNGVLKTINSIYNFSAFKSTYADQDNHTEHLKDDDKWGYDDVAYALGQWVREKHEISNAVSKDELSSTQDAYIKPEVSDPSHITGSFDNFWENFFNFQLEGKWSSSLLAYIAQLKRFEDTKNKYFHTAPKERDSIEDDLLNEAEKYIDVRQEHIRIVNSFLEREKYKIIHDEHNKESLVHYSSKGKIDSYIQVEDFAENPLLTKQEKGAIQARKITEEITVKSRTAKFQERKL